MPKNKSVTQAFARLKDAVQEKKRKMAEDEKKIAEARSQRQFYVDKIRKFEKSLAQDFDQLKQHELNEKSTRLRDLYDKFECKCMLLGCVDANSGTSQEDDEIEAMRSVWQSKIINKIEALNQEAMRQTAVLEKDQNQRLQQPHSSNADEMSTKTTHKHKIKVSYAKFSGNVYEWRVFEKQFKAEIADNNELADEDKLECLREACIDEVRAIVSNAENNFHKAWKTLKELYGDAYNQVHLCIQRFTAISKVDQVTSQSLANLLNKSTKCVDVLKDIMPTGDDSLFAVLAASKLDNETFRMWDRHRSALAESWSQGDEHREKNQHMPTWNDFKTFLNEEVMIYAKQELRTNSFQSLKQTKSKADKLSFPSDAQANLHKNANVVKPQKTPFQYETICPCHKCAHLYKCESFLALDYNRRWKFVEDNCLCERCMRIAHPTVPCENKSNNEPCPMCIHHNPNVIVFHNSTLCPVRFGIHPN